MRVARILYPIVSLGPGKRVALWTAGCKKGCPKCENPELWESSPDQEIDVRKLAQHLMGLNAAYDAHEMTITGGDPLEQPDELLELLRLVRPTYDDILLYTGYTRHELEGLFDQAFLSELFGLVDVMVDGRYIDEKNNGNLALRGSGNQTIHFMTEDAAEKYREYLGQGRIIQNVAYGGRVISVGIHNRDA